MSLAPWTVAVRFAAKVRTALWLFMAYLSDSHYIVEQPMNSVMFKAPPLSTVLAMSSVSRVTTWHGSFGGETPKPFSLHSSLPQTVLTAGLFRRRQRQQTGVKLVKKDKKGKFTGNANLKRSQAYTADFGKAVADMWRGLQ